MCHSSWEMCFVHWKCTSAPVATNEPNRWSREDYLRWWTASYLIKFGHVFPGTFDLIFFEYFPPKQLPNHTPPYVNEAISATRTDKDTIFTLHSNKNSAKQRQTKNKSCSTLYIPTYTVCVIISHDVYNKSEVFFWRKIFELVLITI